MSESDFVELNDEQLLQFNNERISKMLEEEQDLKEEPANFDFDAIHEQLKGQPSFAATMEQLFKAYANRSCLGVCSPTTKTINYMKYSDVWEKTASLATGLSKILPGPAEGSKMDKISIGVCGAPSPSYVISLLACSYLCTVSVPMLTILSNEEAKHIAQEAEIRAIITSLDQLETAHFVATAPDTLVKVVVLMNAKTMEPSSKQQELISQLHQHVKVCFMEDLIAENKIPIPFKNPASGDELAMLMFTSGSTGLPKGVQYSDSRMQQTMTEYVIAHAFAKLPIINYCYLSLAHLAGIGTLFHSLAHGGRAALPSSPDLSTFFEDFQVARPTMAFLVPHVLGNIYKRFKAEVALRISVNEQLSVQDAEKQVTLEYRQSLLGGRIASITTGSAPTSPEVMKFIKYCFRSIVVDGYGSTEAGMILHDGKLNSGVQWKLVSEPELGYTTEDKPYPRGELRVITPTLTKGYFKRELATRDAFDEEGYYKTGDIFEVRNNEEFKYVDRKVAVQKLAQGEFVNLSKLDMLFGGNSYYIRQIYVHGDSTKGYLIAVIVPNMEAVHSYLHSNQIIEAQKEQIITKLAMQDIEQIAKKAQLKSYEVPKDFVITYEPFTQHNGMLSEANKLLRPKVKQHFAKQLEALYKKIEESQDTELESLRQIKTMSARVMKIVENILGVSAVDPDSTFTQLGDSMTAIRFSSAIEKYCGVHIPASILLDKNTTIGSIVKYVEEHQEELETGEYQRIHGKSNFIDAETMRLDKFFSKQEHQELLVPQTWGKEAPKNVLLTGANGFLGRILVLELLEQLPSESKVFCIVRAPNDEAARKRLEVGYNTDPALFEKFNTMARDRLVVLSGDLIKPHFGLQPQMYEELTANVDFILHNGALVNHVLSYRELFEPNVLGTVEMIRFALQKRAKPMTFISTVAVASGLQAEVVSETTDPRKLFSRREINVHHYALGYGLSKWVSELLLQDCAEKTGIPMTVYRCGMILGHSKYKAQINTTDIFFRMLSSIINSKTMFEKSTMMQDGIPVDYVAKSIVAGSLGKVQDESKCVGGPFGLSHVLQDQEHNSEQQIARWIQSYYSNRQFKVIPDLQQWLNAFKVQLEKMNEENRRQQSALPIIDELLQNSANRQKFDNSVYRAELVQEGLLSNNDPVPHLSERLLHKFIDDLKLLNFVDK